MDPKSVKDAHHAGWLAGVALRLGCTPVGRNTYDRETQTAEWLAWESGFTIGFEG